MIGRRALMRALGLALPATLLLGGCEFDEHGRYRYPEGRLYRRHEDEHEHDENRQS